MVSFVPLGRDVWSVTAQVELGALLVPSFVTLPLVKSTTVTTAGPLSCAACKDEPPNQETQAQGTAITAQGVLCSMLRPSLCFITLTASCGARAGRHDAGECCQSTKQGSCVAETHRAAQREQNESRCEPPSHLCTKQSTAHCSEPLSSPAI